MTDMIKPMKAAAVEELSTLKFPLAASPKIDGIRMYIRDGVVLSNSNKPIPNQQLQQLLCECEGDDGEFTFGDPTDPMCFRLSTSFAMSRDKTAPQESLNFWLFDSITYWHRPYAERQVQLKARSPIHTILTQDLIADSHTLEQYESGIVSEGYEGVMLRDISRPYKFGRSTLREASLLKLKRFVDAEAVVLNFIELMHNENDAYTDELGRTKRSSAKDGLIGTQTLGALIVKDLSSQTIFQIGSGFTARERIDLWEQRFSLEGRIVKYKHFPIGNYASPRHPIYLGFREQFDL